MRSTACSSAPTARSTRPRARDATGLRWLERLRSSDELALAQPLGGDPLLALDHRSAAVQALGVDVGAVVAEPDGVALDGRHFEADVGEGGAAALLGRVEVHEQRAHALAAALEDGG